jgi:hypothetical protein
MSAATETLKPEDFSTPAASVPGKVAKITLADVPLGGLSLVNTIAAKDANYFSVSLPSNFHFYDFKTLAVSLVKGKQQAKFTRAAKEHNGIYTIEAVSSLLGGDVTAYELTTGDFYWLLYWILFASYPTSTRMSEITCRDKEHLRRVDAGELPESSLRYVTEYLRPETKEVQLDLNELKAVDVSSLGGLALDTFKVKDLIAWEDMHDEAANAEDAYLFDLAVMLKDGSLQSRIDTVANMNQAQLAALTKYRDAATKHGVIPTLKTKCKECGAENEVSISISAPDFL